MKPTTLLLALAVALAPAARADGIPVGLESHLQELQLTAHSELITNPGSSRLIGELTAFAQADAYLIDVTDDFTLSLPLAAAYQRIQQWSWVDYSLSGEFPLYSDAGEWFQGGGDEYTYVLDAISEVPAPTPCPIVALPPTPPPIDVPIVPPHLPYLYPTPPPPPSTPHVSVPDGGTTLILLTLSLTALALYRTVDDDLDIGFWVVGGISVTAMAIMIACVVAWDYFTEPPDNGRTARELAAGQWYDV